MFKIRCECGQSEKSFKFNIGPAYNDTCCEDQPLRADLTNDPNTNVENPSPYESVVANADVTEGLGDASIIDGAGDVDNDAPTDAPDLDVAPTPTKIDEIVAAISILEKSDFNKTNKDPKIEPLEVIVGQDITADERNEAWAIYQAQNS